MHVVFFKEMLKILPLEDYFSEKQGMSGQLKKTESRIFDGITISFPERVYLNGMYHLVLTVYNLNIRLCDAQVSLRSYKIDEFGFRRFWALRKTFSRENLSRKWQLFGL